MDARQRLTAVVSGRVQGVGFRYFVREEANALGLAGEVKNQRDGSVLVIAEGERHLLEQLLAELQRGPSFSRVDSVDVRWSNYTGAYANFSVSF